MTGITYVVTHPGFQSVKVGFMAFGSDRMEVLAKGGWTPFRHLHVVTPKLARDIEQATLFQVRHRLHAPAHLTGDLMPSAGYTETVSAYLVSAPEVWRIVCEEAGTLQLAPVVRKTPGKRGHPGGPQVRGVRRPGDTAKFVDAARKQAAIAAKQALTDPAN